MDYKLAKQLKDAGFSQNGGSGLCEEKHDHMKDRENCHHPSRPTLSELIEACGDRFEALIKQAGGWVAISNMENYMMKQDFKCVKTPEIAVAKLYLKLNKK